MFDSQAELALPATDTTTATTLLPTDVAAVIAIPFANATLSLPAPTAILKPSFAQALCGTHVQFSDPIPATSIRGETLSIKITNYAYFRGLETYKYNLQSSLVLNKGDKPYTTKDIVAKLHKVWKVSGQWRLLSLGRGFYKFFVLLMLICAQYGQRVQSF